MYERDAGLVGADVGELLQRGEAHAGGAARVAAGVQEVARDQRDVKHLLRNIFNSMHTYQFRKYPRISCVQKRIERHAFNQRRILYPEVTFKDFLINFSECPTTGMPLSLDNSG